MPSISPVPSFGSSESTISNCSDVSVDANFYDRRYVEDSGTDSSQEDSGSTAKRNQNGANSPVNLNGFHQTDDTSKHDSREVGRVNSLASDRDVEIAEDKGELERGSERLSSSNDEACGSSLLNDDVDAEFWLPPDAVDQEDDVFGSITSYDDDDDEFGDGETWGKPSSLSSFGEEDSGSYKFKEEKIKAMSDIKNGKFKALVSQLLKSVGVDLLDNGGENWVDIVTALSWEAAAFVKPDAQEGKAMDPDGYVKIKCIGTGLRSQSRLVKGLVFKKNAAHKHMATNYKNPRLLLIHGSLDLSSGGLSSFESMKQEKENVKSIVDMIDKHHPNVILVEKSVSRGIQESILAKGITLVIDMKLHRLERVARCIGSPILAQEVSIGQKLRQCDSFHIEKFVEELCVSTEGGKKPRKTLMFLEGAPSRQGCTILLMGANSDELKRVKCVVRCAVVMAYHLMLETSFLLDQTAMFSTLSPNDAVDLALTNEQSASDDVQIPNGSRKVESNELILSSEGDPSFSFGACSPATFPGLSISTSIQKVMNDSFPLLSDLSHKLPNFDRRNENSQGEQDVKISLDTVDHNGDQPEVRYKEENPINEEKPSLPEASETNKCSDGNGDHLQNKDDINSVLDSESILILMSSRNASRGTICEQSHFSHIKFYRSFDVPLGKFLQDRLLNQRLQCKTCDEPLEAHSFYYAHHNKQLTVQLRRLPRSKALPGETEGRLWMWSRCGRCKFQDGSSKSTKRVLISNAARGLSFGKFLELGFSNYSSFNRPSSCGHFFDKDFLYFFGLGTMVAMFKYSRVVTYSVALPPQKIEFSSSVKAEFLRKDSENIYSKGISMFLEIEKSLMDLRNRYDGVTLNIQGSSKEFSDVLEMLNQEKSEFEAAVHNAMKNETEDDAVCKLLSLNRVRMELLLESCIWDQRLHALLSSHLKLINSDSVDAQVQEHRQLKENGTVQLLGVAEVDVGKYDSAIEITSESEIKLDASTNSSDLIIKEIPIEGSGEGKFVSGTIVSDDVVNPEMSKSKENGSAFNEYTARPASEDNMGSVEGDTEAAVPDTNHLVNGKHNVSMLSDLEEDKGWIWAPISDIFHEYMEDLKRGYLPKFESCNSYSGESVAQKLILDESSRLHIPLGPNDCVVCDYEDEFSSIIACALTLLMDVPIGSDVDLTEYGQREKESLPRMYSLTAPRWSSNGSLDSDGIHTPPLKSLEDLHSSSFDGLDLLNSLVSYGANHPEVSMGLGKHPGSRKYSVVCVYANEFRQLRDRCCPSEVSYIASLSRCRNWDAKGGKSKSFFAKTLDDRFIIKEIKRTEFDSFMKFAPNYFEYMNQCYELGNQTCLAKILGIYQVVIRVTANGKEARHDLLVMENLSFGRQMARQYDLKGALHARFNSSGNGAGDVLLDQNFVNDMNVSPLYVSRKSKRHLQRAVYNDTNFLNSVNVMDYSLLVGVDTHRRELVCGIIDYLRQYTWDKQLENWVKSSLVVPKNQLPTIISPKEYKKRFRKFIDTHFLSVPDHWCSRRSSNPCRLCGPAETADSSQTKASVKQRSHGDESSCTTSPVQGKNGVSFSKSPHSGEENGFFT
ncbi:putative 1-phosphatidylinositol-3-phosphate 5-kinase FAB1D isoform X2 [Andrographis paniculata]|nr:putative 1-phosphatidylinositol-3-phosphate 5-kinase FAB1D isoform X2 [Andrographis paniculata]